MSRPRPAAGRNMPRSRGCALITRSPSRARLAPTEFGLRRATNPGPTITTATPGVGIIQQARRRVTHAGSSTRSTAPSRVWTRAGSGAHRHGSTPTTTEAETGPSATSPCTTRGSDLRGRGCRESTVAGSLVNATPRVAPRGPKARGNISPWSHHSSSTTSGRSTTETASLQIRSMIRSGTRDRSVAARLLDNFARPHNRLPFFGVGLALLLAVRQEDGAQHRTSLGAERPVQCRDRDVMEPAKHKIACY